MGGHARCARESWSGIAHPALGQPTSIMRVTYHIPSIMRVTYHVPSIMRVTYHVPSIMRVTYHVLSAPGRIDPTPTAPREYDLWHADGMMMIGCKFN